MSTVVVSSWTFAKEGYGLWLVLLLYVVGREGELSSGIEAGRACVYVCVCVCGCCVLCVVCVCVEEWVGCLGDVTDIKAQ